LIGREREQAQVRAWVAEALAGRGSLVLLAGEAGVGKTTLARGVLAGSGLQVLEGVAVQGGTAAFGPIVEVLRSRLRSEGAGRLIEGPLAAHLALLLPELGPAAPEGDRATLFEAIRQALAAIAARHPAALFLDDLQWADDATLELLPALARSVDEQPLLLLGAFRSDELPRGHPIRRMRSELRRAGHLRQVTVEPLGAEATATLLERTLGRAAPSLRRAVFDRTDGVPFFVKELGSALAASGRLESGPSGLGLLEGEDVPLPDSVRDAVLLRAAGLSGDARAAVMAAAVAGQSCDPELVRRRSAPCTRTGTRSGPSAERWSCGRRSATSAPAWTSWSASPAAPSSPATSQMPSRPGVRSPTGADGRAIRCASGRPTGGWPPRWSCRAAGRRHWRAGSRPPPSAAAVSRRTPPRSAWRRPISGRPRASGRR